MSDKRARESDRPPSSEGVAKWQRFVAGLGVLLLLAVVVIVIRKQNEPPPQGGGPFDPSTTNEAELRRVTESISRMFSAPEGRAHTSALEVLESLAVNSAGARDLRDACVTTYRGLIVAQQKLEQVRAILVAPDGGMRPQTELAAGDAARAATLLREADEERDRVSSTRNRCHDLYAISAQRFGLRAERPRSGGQ